MTTRIFPCFLTTRRFALGSKHPATQFSVTFTQPSDIGPETINSLTKSHASRNLSTTTKDTKTISEYSSSRVVSFDLDYNSQILSTNGLFLYGWETLSIVTIQQLIRKNPYFKVQSPHHDDMWEQLRIIGYLHNRQDIIDLCDSSQ